MRSISLKLFSRKIKIAFIINDPYVNNFISFHREIINDKNFECHVFAVNRLGTDYSYKIESQKISDVLKKNKIDHQVINNDNVLRKIKPDYIFTSNPYNIYQEEFFKSKNLSTIAKLCNISYGASMIEWSGPYDFLNNNDFHDDAYRMFVESNFFTPSNAKFHPIGYLKMDDYLHNLKSIKKTICWKPRWTTSNGSSFERFLDLFFHFAQNGYKINFIVHPFFYQL